jgi:thiosulfate reductase/polysulfide reductase chain A
MAEQLTGDFRAIKSNIIRQEKMMNRTFKYSICGICPARCPVQVEVENGECRFIQGNPHYTGIKGALCPRGASAISILRDEERLQFPMIRKGARGEGKWQKATWDEAFDYIAEKLNRIQKEFGARAIIWSDQEECANDLHQAFVRALGSPNYYTADSVGTGNTEHAARSLFGFGRNNLILDLKNSRHVVLQTRNLMECVDVAEINNLMDGLDAGARLTVIDTRANVSAGKADRFFMIRPGTDYALNLAVIHVLFAEKLYNEAFAASKIKDLDRLQAFVSPYTPAFAETETGIHAEEIITLARELAKAAPAVIWHPGRMTARYRDSFQVSRSAYIINALLGSIGSKGGLPFAVTPEDLGRSSLKRMVDLVPPAPEKRADGVGWKYPEFDPATGLLHLAFKAMETGEPYPIKAYFACGTDPLAVYPDPDALKKSFNKLELLVAMPFSWSNTAWYADVVLPLSSCLESDGLIMQTNGLTPAFFINKKCCEQKFDTRASWQIVSGLAKRMGKISLDFDSIEKIWKNQLKDTGASIQDFDRQGFVLLSEKPIYKNREELLFDTPSQKIEIINDLFEKSGIKLLATCDPKPETEPGTFRLTVGSSAVHAPVHTRNNALLNKEMPDNVLWLNKSVAEKMGISQNETVMISNSHNERLGKIRVFLTDFIHPEAVYMVHGLGQTLSLESRRADRLTADNLLMSGGLDIWDPAGGGVALQEHFVKIEKA